MNFKDKKYVVFDLEATCWMINAPKGFKNEIIEIGAVKLDYQGNQIGEFSKFAKPKIFPIISDFCNELTTITQNDIDCADNLSNVLVEFFKWVDGSELISWGNYDKNQLIQDLEINNLDLSNINNLKHYNLKQLHSDWNGRRKKGTGVRGSLRFEGLSFDGTPHRGIDDAKNISKIFIKYIDNFNSL